MFGIRTEKLLLVLQLQTGLPHGYCYHCTQYAMFIVYIGSGVEFVLVVKVCMFTFRHVMTYVFLLIMLWIQNLSLVSQPQHPRRFIQLLGEAQ